MDLLDLTLRSDRTCLPSQVRLLPKWLEHIFIITFTYYMASDFSSNVQLILVFILKLVYWSFFSFCSQRKYSYEKDHFSYVRPIFLFTIIETHS